MKPFHPIQPTLKILPAGRFSGWGIAFFILLLGWGTPVSYGQGTQGPSTNPHADMSAPPLPGKGIIGVAIYVTAERIGEPAGLFIRATHPAGPAAKAGLLHGQQILAVDGHTLEGKTYREVVEMIRGKIGESVTLRINTFNQVKEVTLTRVGEDQLMSQKKT